MASIPVQEDTLPVLVEVPEQHPPELSPVQEPPQELRRSINSQSETTSVVGIGKKLEKEECSVLEHLLAFLCYLVYSPHNGVVMIYIICLSRLLGSGVNGLVAVLYMVRVYKEQLTCNLYTALF